MKWPTFCDSYESAIHKNDELTDIDNFTYLRSLLERTALDAIAGLTLSTANYHEAVEILQKRFGNKPLITSKHMETLFNAEHVKRQIRVSRNSDTCTTQLSHISIAWGLSV